MQKEEKLQQMLQKKIRHCYFLFIGLPTWSEIVLRYVHSRTQGNDDRSLVATKSDPWQERLLPVALSNNGRIKLYHATSLYIFIDL